MTIMDRHVLHISQYGPWNQEKKPNAQVIIEDRVSGLRYGCHFYCGYTLSARAKHDAIEEAMRRAGDAFKRHTKENT